MRTRIAGLALTTAALFLALVAVLLNSNALFYMSTAVIATIAASRLQAWLSVRGLHFERRAPSIVSAGEPITVEIAVWSDRRIRRPLVTMLDNLPARLVTADRSPSLPVAPAFDIPVSTQYRFRPLRRGRYRWGSLTVMGSDALGLVLMTRTYNLPPTELLVLPMPLPVDVDVPGATGWGAADTQEGQARGAGIEPRGIREYVSGDSVRYVHWRSTARTGQLLVKEFDTGSYASIGLVLQRTPDAAVGVGVATPFEQMVSNAAFLAQKFLRQGAEVSFPGIEDEWAVGRSAKERSSEVLTLLASIEADSVQKVSEVLLGSLRRLGGGSLVYVLCAAADPGLPGAVQAVRAAGSQVVCLLYDTQQFLPKKAKAAPMSAAAIEFAATLERAGAQVVVVPRSV